MVARTPPKQHRKIAVALALSPTLLRETIKKVDKCMARLQELQYTVTGGAKVVSGVRLSPRSSRGYYQTSLRCKQESLRIKNANSQRSPPGKLPVKTEEWRRMSLPAMLLGETMGEILQASQFARNIVQAANGGARIPKSGRATDDPKTPVTERRKQNPNSDNSGLHSRRRREKQAALQEIRSENESDKPSLRRAKSRINFKISPNREECNKENCRYTANRISPRNNSRPWAKKTVLFPNPLFRSSSSPTNQNHQKFFCKTKSPVAAVARNHRQTPHKFLIKTPHSASKLKIKSPSRNNISISPKRKSPPTKKPSSSSAAAKLRRSFSPSRLANRLVSPLKGRKSVQRINNSSSSSEGMNMMKMMSGLKQRPVSFSMRFSPRRI